MIESWNDVPGYEGLYEVSDLGRVKNIKTGRILRPAKDKYGYLYVGLYKNGIPKKGKIHRLVAFAFIPNPTNLPQINHRDEDKTNNAVNNLEWCDAKYNNNYSQAKPVLQYDLNGNFIREWPSLAKVYEELGIHKSDISDCCKGRKVKTAGGFVWKFKN